MHVLFLFHAGLKRATIKVIMFRKMKVCSENVRMIQFLPKLILDLMIVDVAAWQCTLLSCLLSRLSLKWVNISITEGAQLWWPGSGHQTLTVMGNTGSKRTDLIPQFFTLHSLLASTCKVSALKGQLQPQAKERKACYMKMGWHFVK